MTQKLQAIHLAGYKRQNTNTLILLIKLLME
jgi:hypothetical protein